MTARVRDYLPQPDPLHMAEESLPGAGGAPLRGGPRAGRGGAGL